MDWLGTNGFGATMTCRRDCLPFGVPGRYFHKQKTLSSQRTKVARFLQPVIAIKEDEDALFRRVHCSFQSTSSCNISTVNALNKCKLSNYFRVDLMDHLIKNTNLAYRSWKYWHSAMLHAK